MQKNSRVTLVSVGLACFLLVAIVCSVLFGDQIRSSFKVSDPSLASFDPMKFDFRDYKGQDKYKSVVAMLPLGTARERVREIMDRTNATTKQHNFRDQNNIDFYEYAEKGYPEYRYGYFFVFDAQQRLGQISCSPDNSCVLAK